MKYLALFVGIAMLFGFFTTLGLAKYGLAALLIVYAVSEIRKDMTDDSNEGTGA